MWSAESAHSMVKVKVHSVCFSYKTAYVCPVKTQIGLCFYAFTIHLTTLWILGYPQSALWRLWSDCADMQADLSIYWVILVGNAVPRLNCLYSPFYPVLSGVLFTVLRQHFPLGNAETTKKKIIYHNNPKYWDTLTPYYTCAKILTAPFYYLLMCLKNCWVGSKRSRPWSDAAFCSIWSGSTLFPKTCLSQYLGLLRYQCFIIKAGINNREKEKLEFLAVKG